MTEAAQQAFDADWRKESDLADLQSPTPDSAVP